MEAPDLPLPDMLKYLREAAGMTQTQLAEALCAATGTWTLTRHEVGRWEQGRVRPKAWLPALAQVLDADLQVLEPAPGKQSPAVQYPDVDEEWKQVSELLRRTFLKCGAALTLPALGLDELRHIASALTDARRYSDDAIVEYFNRSLEDCAQHDRTRGPRQSIPLTLGLLAAIEQTAAEAKSGVRRELLRIGARTAEFAGWLYRDLALPELAIYWLDRAVEWAQAASDLPMQGYVLLKKSQAAWDNRDGLRMLTLAEAVQSGPWSLPARVQAEAAQQVARGHAMLGGDTRTVEAYVGRACDLLDQASNESSSLSPHYDEALFEVQVAHTFALIGASEKALDVYDNWLSPEVFGRRDYGYRLAFKAAVQADMGDIDGAAATGINALAIAKDTSSARTHAALIRLVGDLRPHWQRPAVRELRDAMVA